MVRTPDLKTRPAPESSEAERIGIEAQRRLRRSSYLALRDVECEAHGAGLRLLGRLPSYYLKQMAQAIVADVEGARRVVNLIEVVAPAGRAPQGS